MATIQGVLGPIDTADLGFTLMHEHVIIRSAGLSEQFPSTYPRAEVIARATDCLAEARAHGVKTVVDLTPADLGRDVEAVAEVARRSGMQVVVATGIYWQPPRYFQSRPPEAAAALFARDIAEGIAGTGIRAGIIKVATDETGLDRGVLTILRAAAMAHRATGAPISTHTNARMRTGVLQQEVFASEGVDLSRVVIGHSGDTTDLGYLRGLMARGSMIGMDRFGIDRFLPTADRVRVIADLCREGYAGSMVLGHDANCWWDWSPVEAVRRAMPDWHLLFIPTRVVPELRQAGVSDGDITRMTTENPRVFLERQGAY